MMNAYGSSNLSKEFAVLGILVGTCKRKSLQYIVKYKLQSLKMEQATVCCAFEILRYTDWDQKVFNRSSGVPELSVSSKFVKIPSVTTKVL